MIARIGLVLLSLALVLAACSLPSPLSEPASPTAAIISRPEINAANLPTLDGSTSAEPILASIVCEFLQIPCSWIDWPLEGGRRLVPQSSGSASESFTYSATGTHQSYLNLIDGKADLIIAARKPSTDEWVYAATKIVELEIAPVAMDALVFIVNDDNPIEGLAANQIRSIYTGGVTHWEQVGGAGGEIHPYQRDRNSGSQELMLKLVMRGATMIDAPDMTLLTMMAPFYTVSEDVQGLGYSVYYYEEFLAPLEEKVKLIAVDGAYPSAQTISSRAYPYATEVYIAMRADRPKNDLTRQLYAWLLSSAGQQMVASAGYVPLVGED